MGTHTDYNGGFAIEPPLTWPEVQATEAWSGHPDHYANGFRSRTRKGPRLNVDMTVTDTPDGRLTQYAGTGVEIVGDELRHDGVMTQLRELARQHGGTHRFVGVLECRHDHSDVETPFRVRIVGTDVREIWPVMFWPGDPDVLARIRLVLGQHSGVDLDAADNIAARIFDFLVASYERKG